MWARTRRTAAAALAAVLAAACDVRWYTDVEAPLLESVSPDRVRAGRLLTVLGANLDLTPWDSSDLPPRPDEPEPVVPLPFALEVRIGGESAAVESAGPGGLVVRVPEELAPGFWPVVAIVEGRASNAIAVEVVVEPVTAIAVAPDPLVVEAGERRAFSVWGADAAGTIFPLAGAGAGPAGPDLVLSTTDGRVARVDPETMEVTGERTGEVSLVARLGVLEARVAIVVRGGAR